jgi:type I restriction enzyme M protein
VWLLTNRKRPGREGRVLLVNATGFWTPMRKSLGDKRREVPAPRAAEIVALVERFEETEVSKVFPTTHFGYRKITVERPLRLSFDAMPERVARLEQEGAFRGLAASKKKDPAARAAEEVEGRAVQDAVRAMVASLAGTVWNDRDAFLAALRAAARKAGVKLATPVEKAVVSALGERDAAALICPDRDGGPEPDPELRDTESVPLDEAVEDYVAREVLPYVPDAWVNAGVRDHRDGGVGRVGYEINFNRYFYRYVPPRPLAEIEADIRAVEREIVEMLGGVGA